MGLEKEFREEGEKKEKRRKREEEREEKGERKDHVTFLIQAEIIQDIYGALQSSSVFLLSWSTIIFVRVYHNDSSCSMKLDCFLFCI